MTRSYSSLLSWFGLILAASLILYHTSDRVTSLDRQLHDINAQIEGEQASLHVLKAEWVYLANPARIEAEAKRHLNLQPTTTNHVITLDTPMLASLLPLHNGIEPVPQIQTADADIRDIAPAATTTAKPQIVAAATPRKHDRVFGAINDGHINDHVIMQHGAVVQASTDSIGGLINNLSLHP